MSINVKKYTKDQMAKMVEETEEKFKSKRDEYHELAEQLKSRKKEIVELKSDLVKKNQTISSLKAENAALTKQIDQMNGESITRENVITNLKADNDLLRMKVKDTEASLGRVNADLAHVKSLECKLVNREEDLKWAKNHPWRNLWAWFKRKAARHE